MGTKKTVKPSATGWFPEGYSAVAPFSGTEFDLLQGLFLMVTEGQRIEKRGMRERRKSLRSL